MYVLQSNLKAYTEQHNPLQIMVIVSLSDIVLKMLSD